MADITPSDAAAQSAHVIAELTGVERHDIALTLGSGWNGASELIGETIAEIPAELIPGFSVSGVPGHSGTISSIRLHGGHHALVLGARTHFYEGRGVRAVAHPVRTAAACGARVCILTNGCGTTVKTWAPGDVVVIKDHINLTATSPLEGATFVDLTDAYSPRLRTLAHNVNPNLAEGVYAQFPGPHYETPAEVKMAAILGADLVGMSTALETIAAREAGMNVLALSLITNYAAGIAPGNLSHQEVIEAGKAAGPRIAQLLAQIIEKIEKEEL